MEPVKEEISLDVDEMFRIDSFEIDPEDPPLIQMAVKDDTGNLYLGDSRDVKVYKLDSSGEPVTRFLRKGEGPGEFPRFGEMKNFSPSNMMIKVQGSFGYGLGWGKDRPSPLQILLYPQIFIMLMTAIQRSFMSVITKSIKSICRIQS